MPDFYQIAAIGTPLVLYAGVQNLPPPIDYTGVSLNPIKTGQVTSLSGQTVKALPRSAMLYIRSDEALGVVVTIPGPVELRVGLDTEAEFFTPVLLAGGASIVVSKFNGYAGRVQLSGGWDLLRLVSNGAIVGGTVSVKLESEVQL